LPPNSTFGDSRYAQAAFSHVTHSIPPDLQQGLEILLSQSADPQAVVLRLDRFCEANPSEFQQIAWTPFGLQALISVFSSSEFLSEALLRHPGWLIAILESGSLHRVRSAAEMEADLAAWVTVIQPGPDEALLPLSLASFRRRQILRILVRDVLGFAALPEVTEELSNLADTIINAACRSVRMELEKKYGVPHQPDGSVCGFSVLALGKLGGRELNYSSDIDLMFVYSGPGETGGAHSLSHREFFQKLANRLTELLATYTPEGMIYRVDLRLRPEGRHGEVSISLNAAEQYYGKRARDWELQMLIKARCAAGDAEPARALLDWVQPKIYSTTLDFSAVESMSQSRERIGDKLAARSRPSGTDVKLAHGGIRDIEFLVQCLQRVHGGRAMWLRNSGTLLALNRLRDKDLLSDSEYSRLVNAYQFLRHLEHRLQFAEDRQTHTLPENGEELTLVARRMPAAQLGEESTPESLLRHLNEHLEHVQEVYERVIHAQQPIYYTQSPVAADTPAAPPIADPPLSEPIVSNLVRFLDQRAPAFAAAVTRARLGRNRTAFEHFLEALSKRDDWLRALNQDMTLTGHLLDIFQHSPYFAEQLVRAPDYFEELRAMRTRGHSKMALGEVMPMLEDVPEIRRFFLRQMFRTQAESICLPTPVFQTLERCSALTDAAISACYRVALAQVFEHHPPVSASYSPWQQMMVVALGRLGMQEFDLGSDADIIFILPDADLPELHFWTRVAEKLVSILGSYTGDGTMFAIDTRLVPNGRGGALVQSETAFREYFAHKAETWEGLAYMKARAVTGDIERATAFLAELQKIDWRRYGQSGRSRKELRGMRIRIEHEHGESSPLKNAAGGYYDIDFALMYLRLKSAGIFFKVLNTPQRIEIIEQMGHLEHNDAQFMADAATFYRAVDHGLRLIFGHTEGDLPRSESALDTLTELVKRWVPDHLTDQPLHLELLQIRERTRRLFDRLFEVS
jgi:[glutamine synthetase] adenylyltransferase / [glutamine synthetase]-adenylyl-L-tyrosine phosphorylase